MMLVGSSRSAALAHRIGPRLQLTVGPLILAGGLLLLSRVGVEPEWIRDLLPGAVLLGLGLVTFVAPLTATVMGAVDDDHVSTASGVNNAIARTASLASLAVIPGIAGLTTATDPAQVSSACQTALVIAAALAAIASPISLVGLAARQHVRRSPRPRLLPGRRTTRSTRSDRVPLPGRRHPAANIDRSVIARRTRDDGSDQPRSPGPCAPLRETAASAVRIGLMTAVVVVRRTRRAATPLPAAAPRTP